MKGKVSSWYSSLFDFRHFIDWMWGNAVVRLKYISILDDSNT